MTSSLPPKAGWAGLGCQVQRTSRQQVARAQEEQGDMAAAWLTGVIVQQACKRCLTHLDEAATLPSSDC